MLNVPGQFGSGHFCIEWLLPRAPVAYVQRAAYVKAVDRILGIEVIDSQINITVNLLTSALVDNENRGLETQRLVFVMNRPSSQLKVQGDPEVTT